MINYEKIITSRDQVIWPTVSEDIERRWNEV